MKKSIENRCKDAIIYYFKLLLKGQIIPQNLNKAQKFIRKIFKNEDDDLYFLLYGKLLKKEKLFEDAQAVIEKSLKSDKSEILYEYGKLLHRKDSNSDKENSEYYFKKAIEKGYLPAMHKYGMILINEEKKLDEGLKYLKMAADLNYPKSCYQYSLKLNENNNDAEYKKYIEIAAKNGHIKGMYLYGFILQDYEESLKYFKKSADKGCIESIFEYGFILYNKNSKKASYYLKIASDNGYLLAMNYYATKLINGDGIQVDAEKGIEYLQNAIDKGYSTSMNTYAYMLEHGEGMPINKEKAIKYYKIL